MWSQLSHLRLAATLGSPLKCVAVLHPQEGVFGCFGVLIGGNCLKFLDFLRMWHTGGRVIPLLYDWSDRELEEIRCSLSKVERRID